jgi:hypothetical protein
MSVDRELCKIGTMTLQYASGALDGDEDFCAIAAQGAEITAEG